MTEATPPAVPPPVPDVAPQSAPTPVLSYVTPIAAAAAPGAWREKNILIVSKNWVLPPTCVKCGAPAEGQAVLRKFYWHHPALYLLILLPYGLFVYLVVALVVMKRGNVFIGLCPTHRRRRWIWPAAGMALALGGIAGFVYGAGTETPLWLAAGAVGFISGLVLVVMGQTLRAKRIDAHYLWLKGVSPDFLGQFPAVAPPA